jgi:hypothetical protein
MRLATIAAITLLAVVGLTVGLSLAGGSSHALSETSSVAAAPLPTATYVSELGPVSVHPPRQSITLPASGTAGVVAGIAWSKFAGIALVIVGALMIHGALSLRRTPAP